MKKFNMKICFYIIYAFGIVVPDINAQQSYNFGDVEHQINSEINNKTIPSVVVAIAKDGKIVYENAFGLSDIENNVKATINTPYLLASVSKTVTATGIMVLNKKGMIDIESPAEDYIKPLRFHAFEGKSENVKLTNLLNHTSGLGTYFNLTYADEDVVFTGLNDAFKKYGNLYHPPGTVCEYSNLGYGILCSIISQNSGESYSQFMEDEVFKPLGMVNTFVEHTNRTDIRIAKKYDSKLQELPEIRLDTRGAGNVHSSVHDLILFGMFHLKNTVDGQKKILDYDEIDQMQEFKDEDVLYHYYNSAYYGLGWYCMPDENGYKIVWHEGGMMGASSIIKLIPEENIAIAVITNISNNQICQKIANDLGKIVLPEYNPTVFNEAANYKSYTADSAFFGQWKGTIHVEDLDIPCSITLKPDGTAIFDYLDFTFKSYFTQYNPIPHKTFLISAIINENSFLGTLPGILPSSDLRREYSHFLSLKLLKNGNNLSGTVVAIAAAEREYYAHPFYIKLEKQ